MDNDLISRSELLDDIQAAVDNGGMGGMVAGALKRYVKRGPAVDAVIPVRCKECKHLMFSDCYGECRIGHMGIVQPDDFCSRGERKEADHE